MSYKKIQKQIRKISVLAENIAEDEEVSTIERDLLLSYVRKLYEQVLDLDLDEKVKPSSTSTKPVEKVVLQDTPTPQVQNTTPVTPAPEPTPKPEPEPVEAPVVERKPFERAPKANTAVVTEPVQKVVESIPEPEPVAVASATSPMSAEMKALFQRADSKELSDKLSNLPIADLTKAFSINERIFTIQELFNGNQDLFNSTISKVNAAANYEEATQILADGVAKELNWSDESKIRKAEGFVKKVQRRFN